MLDEELENIEHTHFASQGTLNGFPWEWSWANPTHPAAALTSTAHPSGSAGPLVSLSPCLVPLYPTDDTGPNCIALQFLKDQDGYCYYSNWSALTSWWWNEFRWQRGLIKCSTKMIGIKDSGLGLEPPPVQGDDPLAPWVSPATVWGPPVNTHTFIPGSDTQSNSISANNPFFPTLQVLIMVNISTYNGKEAKLWPAWPSWKSTCHSGQWCSTQKTQCWRAGKAQGSTSINLV